ncbi:hypothetical protein [Demequina litorisediminis]|uniref:hypothetical protein n=1 Tax=Demequina litorisediminis TaxID=1849022 RepID=UPI0024E1168F|nr:hypothetical protein [Demequina litorisediminis]
MILAIDTSASVSVALTDETADTVLAERAEFAPRGHAEPAQRLRGARDGRCRGHRC